MKKSIKKLNKSNDMMNLALLTLAKAQAQSTSALDTLRRNFARANSDPHYIGLDGKRYDVMPDKEALLFACTIDQRLRMRNVMSLRDRPLDTRESSLSNNDICITGIHKTAETKDGERPSWMTSIFIKFLQYVIYYDVENHFVVDGCPGPTPPCYWLNEEYSSYLLAEDKLQIWIPEFGTIVVENCAGFNLNLIIIQNDTVIHNIRGILSGKSDQKQLYTRPERSFEKLDFLLVSKLPEEDQKELLFDYQYIPKNIRDNVLQANIKAITYQSKVASNYQLENFPYHPKYDPSMLDMSSLLAEATSIIENRDSLLRVSEWDSRSVLGLYKGTCSEERSIQWSFHLTIDKLNLDNQVEGVFQWTLVSGRPLAGMSCREYVIGSLEGRKLELRGVKMAGNSDLRRLDQYKLTLTERAFEGVTRGNHMAWDNPISALKIQ